MLMPPPFADEHDTYMANYRRTGIRRIIGIGRVVTGLRSDGSTFPIELSIGEVRFGSRTLYTGFVRDISQRQGTERRLETLQAEMLHVGRLNAMGQMSAAIAHELNQPLTAVMNYIKAGRRTLDTGAAESVPRAIEMIDKAGVQVLRAGAIIRNLREFVEKRDTQRGLENLNRVAEEAVALGIVGTAHLDVKIRLDLDPAIPPVMIDRIQIQQVVINLIRNSLEAMQGEETRELAIATANGDGNCVELTVSDTGPGLPADVRARLFQPFTTTKARGMGIGLSISHSIVNSHGGTISAVNRAPTGTVFRIVLPGAGLEGVQA